MVYLNVVRAVMEPPIPPGLVVDFDPDEIDAFLAEECVYATPVTPVPPESN